MSAVSFSNRAICMSVFSKGPSRKDGFAYGKQFISQSGSQNGISAYDHTSSRFHIRWSYCNLIVFLKLE